ncbi:MAG: hypothetical protein NTY25_10200, partial [Planctomycetia bacterium]|nr:hypothetical protein [Planctomycetia bacterium]
MASQIRPSKAPITAPKGAAGASPVQPVRKPGAAPPAKPVPVGPVRPVATKPTASSAQEVPKAGAPKPEAQPEPQGRSLGANILGQAPAWAVSMLLHIVVLLSMALVVSEPPKQEEPRLITSTAPEVAEEFE